jgi:CheY-like chemotaxis protein
MSRRILLVDDEDDIREVAQLSLEMTREWEVVCAASGREALAIAAADPPDAILVDVMMPEMDGPTLVHRLRSEPAVSDVPVVLLTAKVQGADRNRFAELGIAGVMAKPFDPLRLGDEIAELLGWDD